MAKKTSETTPNGKNDGADLLSQRAKTLVSVLGQDFARSSKHPFFDRLLELASKTGANSKPAAHDPGLSRSLAKLVRDLDNKKAKPVKAQRPAAKPAPRATAPKASKPSTPKPPLRPEDLINQHPVVIAKNVRELPMPERTKILRTLPGPTSRAVLRILSQQA